MRKKRIISLVAVVLLTGVVFLLVNLFSIKNKPRSNEIAGKNLLNQAKAKLVEGDLVAARDIYNKVMEETGNLRVLEKIKKKIEQLNIAILFSPIIDECSVKYTVEPGDVLSRIAKKFGTTVALIKRSNGLTTDIIRPGDELKVNTCRFSIVVDKSQNILFLKRSGKVIKAYVVSTGKDNSTPVGKFKITNEKLENPTWFRTGAVVSPDSPENILGSRWMGLNIEGYGIHGNRNINEMGKQVTQGCVRMKNEEVEDLFDIIPAETEVEIVD